MGKAFDRLVRLAPNRNGCAHRLGSAISAFCRSALPASHSVAYATYQATHCAAMPSPGYQEAHTAWYDRVRGLLRQLRKPFVDVTFNESTRGLSNVLDRVYALTRLSGGQELAAHIDANLTRLRAKVLNETCQPPPALRRICV